MDYTLLRYTGDLTPERKCLSTNVPFPLSRRLVR
jgi:hypothetical protein